MKVSFEVDNYDCRTLALYCNDCQCPIGVFSCPFGHVEDINDTQFCKEVTEEDWKNIAVEENSSNYDIPWYEK